MSSVAPDSMNRPGIGLLGRFSFRSLAMAATAGIIVATTTVLTQVNEQQTRGIIEQEAEAGLLMSDDAGKTWTVIRSPGIVGKTVHVVVPTTITTPDGKVVLVGTDT